MPKDRRGELTREQFTEDLGLHLLVQILRHAAGARPANLDEVIDRAVCCAAHAYRRVDAGDRTHTAHVRLARDHAAQGHWAIVAYLLHH
jgi:hypothetical protein